MDEDHFHLGVKAIITNHEGKILLLQRPLQKGGVWDLPGGRLQRGEEIEETLRREVYEETGINNFDAVSFLSMEMTDIRIQLPQGEVGLIFSLYHLDLHENVEIVLSEEHESYQWMEREDAIRIFQKIYPSRVVNAVSHIKTKERV